MLKRGAYKTKKRKREFELTYAIIDRLKRYINNMKIEIESHERHNRQDEVKRLKESISEIEIELKEYEKNGWSII